MAPGEHRPDDQQTGLPGPASFRTAGGWVVSVTEMEGVCFFGHGVKALRPYLRSVQTCRLGLAPCQSKQPTVFFFALEPLQMHFVRSS